MTDYTWPSAIVPSSCALTWNDNTREFVSPLSGTTRTEELPGGRWNMSITVMDLKSRTGAADPLHVLEAFLFKLNGKAHRVVMRDYSYSRSGPGGGDPRVDGSAQTGLTLNTYGWPISTTVLYAGDRIGVSNQMIPVAADVTSNGTGHATISLAHPIRVAPVTLSAIEIDNPTARYILSNKASFSAKAGLFKTVLLELNEAIL